MITATANRYVTANDGAVAIALTVVGVERQHWMPTRSRVAIGRIKSGSATVDGQRCR